MNNFLREFSHIISSLHRYSKQAIAIITDIALCVLCTWLALSLRLEELILFKDFNLYPALISVIIAIPIFWLFGLYRTIFRYTGLSIIFTIMTSTLVYGMLYFLVIGVYGIEGTLKPHGIQGVPRSIGVIQPMILFFGVIFSRLIVKFLFSKYLHSNEFSKKLNVLVYGAGEAGRQLVIALENSPEFKVEGFLDDNKQLHRQVLLGQNIYSPLNLEKVVRIKNISLVFLALPTINRNKRNEIIENLNQFKLTVKTLPSISEIVDGRVTLSDVKDLNVDDLLNRNQVEPDIELLNKTINSKTVLVTGAGGSIGSELCRQIAKLKPTKLLLLEKMNLQFIKFTRN